MRHDYCHRNSCMCYGRCPDCSTGEYDEGANRVETFLENRNHIKLFAQDMEDKMSLASENGRGGWSDKINCKQADLSRMLRQHVEKGDPVDVANFCMMLHRRGERIL